MDEANLGTLVDCAGRPEDIAIIDFDGKTTREVTYRELDDLADGAARALVKLGFSRGERIALLAANSSSYLAIHMGIMRAGMISVPINYRLPRHLTDYIIEDCGARLVFCDAERSDIVPGHLKTVRLDNADDLTSFVDPGSFDAVRPEGDEAATFLYTSGSTGRPKGVVLSHRAQRWVVEMRAPKSISSQRAIIAAPLYHMNALALSHLVFAGHASMVLMPQFATGPYVDAIRRFRCTWLTSVPPMIAMMLDDKAAMSNADFSSVQHLRMGSAPASKSLLDEIAQVFPDARVMNAYGTTEGSPIVFAPHPDGKPTPALSLGCKHPAVELRLRADAGGPADEGVLEMRSPGLMNGYHNRPDLPLPFTDDGYYTTGDVFSRDEDGFYYFVGRTDDMFVCGGENIFPGDVERILEMHPGVGQACVVPVPDAIKGQKPVAFVRLAHGAHVQEDELKSHSLEYGAAYQHPRFIWFVEDFPLASTNKIDRAILMQQATELVKTSQSSPN